MYIINDVEDETGDDEADDLDVDDLGEVGTDVESSEADKVPELEAREALLPLPPFDID